jgi:hypothetical protein
MFTALPIAALNPATATPSTPVRNSRTRDGVTTTVNAPITVIAATATTATTIANKLLALTG